MDKQLRRQLIAILEACTEGRDGFERAVADPRVRIEYIDGLRLLRNADYADPDHTLTTLAGRKYLERLRAPRKTWLKDHWFAVSIAATTAFIALASVIVQAVSLILE